VSDIEPRDDSDVPGRAVAILDDVHVTYRTFDDPRRSVRHMATRIRGRREQTVVQAVRGVTMTLHEGEFFGLIGANGSGKSTLLQAMTGLQPIEAGTIRVKSRPRLLGVGAALRPGVSGRRNIMIGGLALGIPMETIQEQLDELVEFVDIGEAIDRPMRTYSSGMRARLNFTVATLSPPDILLVDEALVVGDAAFKERSEERIDGILQQSGTVVLVNHNVADIAARCDRVGWLHEGVMKEIGEPERVVEAYMAHATRR